MSAPSAEGISVLHVDDDPQFGDLTATMLEREEGQLAVETVTSAEDGLALVEADRFDCIVSDYDMPGTGGIEFLEAVRDISPNLPFILYTGKGSEEVASEAISAGVTDYLQKGSGTEQYTVLANRITNAVERYEAERERRQWKRAVETAREGIAILDDDGRYVQMNEAYARAYGLTPDELLGRTSDELYPEDVAEWFEDVVRPELRREGTWEGEAVARRADGTRFEQQLSLATLEDGGHVCVMNDISEYKKRRERYEKTSSRLEVLFEQSPDMINVHDSDGNIIDPNPKLVEKTGYDASELTDMKVWELDRGIDPDEAATLWRAMDPGDSERLEGAYQRRDGSTFPVEVHVGKLDLDSEDRFVATSRDITDRKERERKLEQLRERTRELLSGETAEETARLAVSAADDIIDAPLSGVHLLNDEGTALEPVAVVDSVPEVFSEPPSFERNAPPGSRAALVWNVFRDGRSLYTGRLSASDEVTEESPAESVLLHPMGDHGVFIISSTEPDAFTATDRQLVEILANHLEVALDRVDREQVLRTRERRLEGLHEATRDLIQADSEAEIAERIVGAAEDILDFSIVSVRLYDPDAGGLVPVATTATVPELLPERQVFTPGDDSLNWEAFEAGEVRVYDDIEAVETAVDQGTGIRSLMHLPLGEFGTIAVAETTPGAFDDTDEFLARILTTAAETALDAQRQKARLRDRRAELERRNARLDEFASAISHDLRNPLNVAETQLELAAAECDSESLDHVERAHERMNALIDDLLTLAREGEQIGDLAPVDLETLVRECWQTVDTAGATLVIDCEGRIRADRGRVQQLLENLVRNAVEHSGDTVTVTVGKLEDGFYLADDGVGIPEDERSEVFDVGYSTSEAGTGLGLSIVEQVARAHGWDVRVTGGDDGGTRFEITGVTFADEVPQ